MFSALTGEALAEVFKELFFRILKSEKAKK